LEAALKAAPLLPSQYPEARLVQLPILSEHVAQLEGLNKDDMNSAILNYYQIGPENIEEDVVIDLLAQIIKEPFYNQLRTIEQLGYLVWSGIRSENGIQGFRAILQSQVKDPVGLDERVESFLLEFRGGPLLQMTPEEFFTYVAAVISKKEEKDKTLRKQALRYWREIITHKFLFKRVEQEVVELKKLTKEQLLAFFDKFIAATGSHRSKLSSQVFGNKHPLVRQPSTDRVKFIEISPTIFKRSMPLYPVNT